MTAIIPLAKQRRLTGKHVLYMLLGFFGFVTIVNAIFIFFALESWPGLSTQDAYRKGLAYNKTLAEAQIQAAQGWQSKVSIDIGEPLQGSLMVRIMERAGVPVERLAVTAYLKRPIHEKFDRAISLIESKPGLYQQSVSLPLSGRWQVSIEAKSSGRIAYRMDHELMIK